MATLDTSFEISARLAADFLEHKNSYLQPGYSESQLRTDFLDKLLTSLGWDVAHVIQKNPFKQEVKVERTVTEGAAKRRADYAFFVEPNFNDPRLFLEAKKPSVDLRNPNHYFQAVRYGWNSQCPIVALTNFHQLHLLDCRLQPDVETVLSRAVRQYSLDDFSDRERFAEIFFLLSRDSVAAGALEEFSASLPRPRGKAVQRGLFKGGYQRLDKTFLGELEADRTSLARSLARLNPDLDGYALTEVTQRILDRLIFIRFLEDKLIEPKYLVASFGGRGTAWDDFLRESRRLDSVYNGVVFKQHSIIDSTDVRIDDEAFSSVCERLSHYNSPYDFNFIPIHLLGSIYERFLGSVVTVKEGRATLEEKPEVRKAGGVYYTPEYVVQHLVQRTVGQKVVGRSPAQMAKIRVCDLACGSGSFLLGVFSALLDEHRSWYNKNPERAAREGCFKGDDGAWHLSLGMKRQILTNSIFGTDIDPQAVEVAQLSLYLKLLEEETTASAKQYELEMRETLLPSLKENIVCGNAIIEDDILTGQMFPEDVERKLNPSNLRSVFRHVLAEGGFDVIIGNPPYVRPHNVPSEQKRYFWQRWTVYTRKADIYGIFIERATDLLKPDGALGYILSKGWMRLDSFEALRSHILGNYKVVELCDMPARVFEDAAVETATLVIEREPVAGARGRNQIAIRRCEVDNGEPVFSDVSKVPQKAFASAEGRIFDTSILPSTEAIKRKMRVGQTIGELFDVKFGLKTGDDSRFLHRTETPLAHDRPVLRGEDVRRYGVSWNGEYVAYLPAEMRRHRPTARPGEAHRFEQPKVLVKDTSKRLGCAYDDAAYYAKDVLIIVPRTGSSSLFDLRFVTAVINSTAMTFYYRTTYTTLHVQNGELSALPLPPVNFSDSTQRALHDGVVEAVTVLMATYEKIETARTDREQDFLRRRAQSIEESIEEWIAQLYRLSENDRRTIETTVATLGAEVVAAR